MTKPTPKQEAEMATAFLETPFGQHYITELGLIYNGLHQDAERGDLSFEQKALKVERAAGVRQAIDWLKGRQGALKAGVFPKDE